MIAVVDVYLIRHADAVEETLALPDIARQLSAAGRDQARALGERLRWHDCTPSAVWTSPLVRAVQTTELLVAGLRFTGEVIARPDLAPGGNAHGIEAELATLAPTASVVMVGHEPGLSGLGGLLIGRADFAVLHKCEAVRISDRAVRWRFAHDDEAPRSASKS
jgi:phosphohistidine phosphatase